MEWRTALPPCSSRPKMKWYASDEINELSKLLVIIVWRILLHVSALRVSQIYRLFIPLTLTYHVRNELAPIGKVTLQYSLSRRGFQVIIIFFLTSSGLWKYQSCKSGRIEAGSAHFSRAWMKVLKSPSSGLELFGNFLICQLKFHIGKLWRSHTTAVWLTNSQLSITPSRFSFSAVDVNYWQNVLPQWLERPSEDTLRRNSG